MVILMLMVYKADFAELFHSLFSLDGQSVIIYFMSMSIYDVYGYRVIFMEDNIP